MDEEARQVADEADSGVDVAIGTSAPQLGRSRRLQGPPKREIPLGDLPKVQACGGG